MSNPDSFASLPKEYFRQGYIARLRQQTSEEKDDPSHISVEKLGGGKPVLSIDESWPTTEEGEYMTFIGQFYHPIYKQFMRFFLNLNDPDEGQFDVIKAETLKEQKFQIQPKGPPESKFLPCYEIISWHEIRELIDFDAIYKFYSENVNLFLTDFKDELSDKELSESIPQTLIYSVVNQEYNFSPQRPSCPPLKVEGTPYSQENHIAHYLQMGTIFQICRSEEIDLPFVVGRLMGEEMDFNYET